ncbi:MAG TPA: peptide MFS transporter [Rubricoccaceae bacterium]|jgi:POT family proton-dependent oligopeptide transporter
MPDDAAAEIQDPRGRSVFGGPGDGPGDGSGTMARTDFSQDGRFFGHPAGLATLFTTEMWERFSFYGLRPLLVLFMAALVSDGGFGFERGEASAIVGIYGSFVYLMSLPGGWVADRLLGLRRAVFWGAVLITLGHVAIGLSGIVVSKAPFFLGLVLIVLGTGLLKPNISAIVGDLYPEGGARRDAGYSLYYMGINTGAFFGQILTGSLAAAFGWHWGFGLAGFGMFVGLVTFAIYNKRTLGSAGLRETGGDGAVSLQRTASPGDRRDWGIVAGVLALIALLFVLATTGAFTLDAETVGEYMVFVLVGLAAAFFAYMFIATSGQERKQVAVILVLFVFAAIFWSAFEQAPTSLNLFANDFTVRSYDTSWVPAGLRTLGLGLGIAAIVAMVGWFSAHVGRRGTTAGFPLVPALSVIVAGTVLAFLGFLAGRDAFEIPTTWFQSINALCIILFAPMFAVLWVTLARRGGDLSAPAKFALGLALAGIGFAVMIPAANLIAGAGDGSALRVSAWWLVLSYFLQSLGELCLSPVGLSSMTKLSPRRFVGQMLGVWFLAASVGHLIGGLVGDRVDPENVAQMPGLFLWTTVALFVAAGILAALIVPIRRMMAATPEVAGAGH